MLRSILNKKGLVFQKQGLIYTFQNRSLTREICQDLPCISIYGINLNQPNKINTCNQEQKYVWRTGTGSGINTSFFQFADNAGHVQHLSTFFFFSNALICEYKLCHYWQQCVRFRDCVSQQPVRSQTICNEMRTWYFTLMRCAGLNRSTQCGALFIHCATAN